MAVEIVLASTSPRRIELLSQFGWRVRILAPSADEVPRRGEAPRDLVARLSREKAVSVAPKIKKGSLVIAADTIVVAPDRKTILGKPKDRKDARRMLRMLSGRMHSVYTGYAVMKVRASGSMLSPDRLLTRVIRSTVKMRGLSTRDIDRYIATGESVDKAGAYAAQGIGMALIESIHGSYANVVGLPICHLMKDIETIYGISFLGEVRK